MADGREMAEGSGANAAGSPDEKKEGDAAAPAAAAAAAGYSRINIYDKFTE